MKTSKIAFLYLLSAWTVPEVASQFAYVAPIDRDHHRRLNNAGGSSGLTKREQKKKGRQKEDGSGGGGRGGDGGGDGAQKVSKEENNNDGLTKRERKKLARQGVKNQQAANKEKVKDPKEVQLVDKKDGDGLTKREQKKLWREDEKKGGEKKEEASSSMTKEEKKEKMEESDEKADGQVAKTDAVEKENKRENKQWRKKNEAGGDGQRRKKRNEDKEGDSKTSFIKVDSSTEDGVVEKLDKEAKKEAMKEAATAALEEVASEKPPRNPNKVEEPAIEEPIIVEEEDNSREEKQDKKQAKKEEFKETIIAILDEALEEIGGDVATTVDAENDGEVTAVVDSVVEEVTKEVVIDVPGQGEVGAQVTETNSSAGPAKQVPNKVAVKPTVAAKPQVVTKPTVIPPPIDISLQPKEPTNEAALPKPIEAIAAQGPIVGPLSMPTEEEHKLTNAYGAMVGVVGGSVESVIDATSNLLDGATTEIGQELKVDAVAPPTIPLSALDDTPSAVAGKALKKRRKRRNKHQFEESTTEVTSFLAVPGSGLDSNTAASTRTKSGKGRRRVLKDGRQGKHHLHVEESSMSMITTSSAFGSETAFITATSENVKASNSKGAKMRRRLL